MDYLNFSTLLRQKKFEVDVSREMFDDFHFFIKTLLNWQKKHNLISRESEPQVWERHLLDSLQLSQWVRPDESEILDLGSGGGFPGIVLALFFKKNSNIRVTLVESNSKKIAFLKEISRELNLHTKIFGMRIDKTIATKMGGFPDVVTCRALCSLQKLLAYVNGLIGPQTRLLALKGKTVDSEIEQISHFKNLTYHKYPSLLTREGFIVEIKPHHPH